MTNFSVSVFHDNGMNDEWKMAVAVNALYDSITEWPMKIVKKDFALVLDIGMYCV